MRPLVCTLALFVSHHGLYASYFFECSAEIKVTATQGEKISFEVVSVKECGNHLQKGEKKSTVYKSSAATPPAIGKTYRVLYRYIAPECMQKDGKPVDCHREIIEIGK